MFRLLGMLILCASFTACDEAKKHAEDHVDAAVDAMKGDPAAEVAPGPGAHFAVAGMEFTAPENWVPVQPTSNMRQASFEFGPVGTDTEKAEMHVFYFGPGDGGDVDANVQRWLSQMAPAEGAQAQEPEHSMFTASGYPVHLVKVDGTYSQSMGPASAHGEPKAGYRLAGAIVEGAQGNVFFKITGPAATVRAMEPGLQTMLEGLGKGRE